MSDTLPTGGLAERVAWVTAQLGRIGHDGKMTAPGSGNYSYTSVDALADQIRPLMSQAQIALVPADCTVLEMREIPRDNGKVTWLALLKVTWNLMCPGEAQTCASIGKSLDTSDKAFNKAHRFAEKNALQAIFHPSTGEDPDAHYETVTRTPRSQPRQEPARTPQPMPDRSADISQGGYMVGGDAPETPTEKSAPSKMDDALAVMHAYCATVHQQAPLDTVALSRDDIVAVLQKQIPPVTLKSFNEDPDRIYDALKAEMKERADLAYAVGQNPAQPEVPAGPDMSGRAGGRRREAA